MNNQQQNELKKRFEIGDLIGAERICLELYEKNQNNLHAIKNLALVYMLQGKIFESVALYEKGYKIQPIDFDILINLAVNYSKLEDYDKAFDYIDKALNIEIRPHAYKLKAEIFLKLRQFEQADLYIDKALEAINSNSNNIQQALIDETIYRKLEILNTAKSKLELKNYLKKNPTYILNPNIFLFVSRSIPEVITNQNIIDINEALKKVSNSNLDSIIRYEATYIFALANYFSYIQDYEQSEQYFLRGNKIAEQLKNFIPFEMQKFIQNLKEAYNKIPKLEFDKEKGKELIFIVGMPRSGTTLLESIIANSDDVFPAGELASFKHLIQFEITTYSKNNYEKIDEYTDGYLSKINFIKGNKKFIIDKLPFNAFLIGFIRKILPGAKIVIMERDPWDTAISIFQQNYLDKHYYSTSFFKIALQTANYYHIRDYWLSLDNKNTLKLRYEDLVSDPQRLSREIYEFCGIQHTLNLEKRKEFYSNTASYDQVKRDINTKSVKKDMFLAYKEQFLQDLDEQAEYWNLQKN